MKDDDRVTVTAKISRLALETNPPGQMIQELGEDVYRAALRKIGPSIPERHEIARRHGISDLEAELVGTTTAELEADAAAKAALRMVP